jgi:hypothetical protein
MAMTLFRPAAERHIRTLLRQAPVVALLGARQVGKTTLARQVAASWRGPTVTFDLEDPRDVARLADCRGLVVLDEAPFSRRARRQAVTGDATSCARSSNATCCTRSSTSRRRRRWRDTRKWVRRGRGSCWEPSWHDWVRARTSAISGPRTTTQTRFVSRRRSMHSRPRGCSRRCDTRSPTP